MLGLLEVKNLPLEDTVVAFEERPSVQKPEAIFLFLKETYIFIQKREKMHDFKNQTNSHGVVAKVNCELRHRRRRSSSQARRRSASSLAPHS